jgi:hypothetical protein
VILFENTKIIVYVLYLVSDIIYFVVINTLS